MQRFSIHVGLDVHKNSIHVAFANSATGEFGSLGGVANDLTRLRSKLRPLGAPRDIEICYEAGPTGYGLCRDLRALGYECNVVAPAKTPSIGSDRVKTDKRDAMKLARFLASGHLTPIRVPTPSEEALRDVVRAREDLKIKETNTKRQLSALMLRHGRRFTGGKKQWTKKHREWLHRQSFDREDSNVALRIYLAELDHYAEMIQELDARIEVSTSELEQADLVNALRAFKGIKTLTAATIVAEIGDLRRFPTAAKFASFLGLTPSEHSSGETRSRGRITKAGNGRVRRMLVEAAWHYRHSPWESQELLARSEGVSKRIRAHAMKTQERLYKRMKALRHRDMLPKKANVAIARELACAIWSAGREVQTQS